MITRRTLLERSVAMAGSYSALSCAQTTVAQEYADVARADKWVFDALKKADPSKAKGEVPGPITKGAIGTLFLGRFADPMYYLLKVIGWDPEPKQRSDFKSVRVPVGFVTDFASIPQVFWTMLPPDGLYTYPAIIHDYLYWEQFLSRDQSDLVLKLAMEDFKVNAAAREAIYAGVRAGGSFAWGNNAKRKAKGEKRILRKLPENPTTRWEEWKKGDVF